MDETLRRLIASANIVGHLGEIPQVYSRKEHVLTRKARQLSPRHFDLLMELLSGDRVLLTVAGESYAAKKHPEGWALSPLFDESPDRIVIGNECTCEDHRYRHTVCKHIEAIRRLT